MSQTEMSVFSVSPSICQVGQFLVERPDSAVSLRKVVISSQRRKVSMQYLNNRRINFWRDAPIAAQFAFCFGGPLREVTRSPHDGILHHTPQGPQDQKTL